MNKWQIFSSTFVLVFLFINSCTSKSGKRSTIDINDTTDAISGRVIAIIDGDTYDVLFDRDKTVRIRMEGIDAPEGGMPFYKVSKKYLGSLCMNKYVKIQVTGKDRHGRYLGFTFMEDGTELSHEMIKTGLAWHFKKYNSDQDLADLETQAKNLKKGLWRDKNPMAPWRNRELHRKGISTKDSFNLNEVKNKATLRTDTPPIKSLVDICKQSVRYYFTTKNY